jgi:hypothetical protein
MVRMRMVGHAENPRAEEFRALWIFVPHFRTSEGKLNYFGFKDLGRVELIGIEPTTS